MDAKNLEILTTNFAKGSKHDFKIFKDSKLKISEKIKMKADSGYVGLNRYHNNSILPKKKSKNNPLTKEDKKHNRLLSQKRIFVEHVIGKVKIFKILSDSYRNRRKQVSRFANFSLNIFHFI